MEFKETFPKVCPWISSFHVGSSEFPETVYLGLSNRNKLYANGSLISSECTSYFVHNKFLVLSTLSHTVRFLPLKTPFKDFMLSDRVPSVYDEEFRKVEIGARIVAITPGDIKLILQMPRGNLETVYPRALVLATVRDALDR